MYRLKQLLGGRLSLRIYNAKVSKTYAMMKALNKLTGLGMPDTCRVTLETYETGRLRFQTELRNKVLCASNDTLIDRTSIPKDISKKLIKAESIGSCVKSLIKKHRVGSILNPNPTFNRDELYRLVHFLNEQHVPTSSPAPKVHIAELSETEKVELVPAQERIEEAKFPQIRHGFNCKKCQSPQTEPRYGKYGYYVYCP